MGYYTIASPMNLEPETERNRTNGCLLPDVNVV